ncbi:type I-F CRISPR-associated protein Csy1 [Photorhabdus luminescens]|uniref:Type I-F CRISPR-associated protein Csy1 n=1 Tax=Photorhabdus luminescens subsp. sonorensis TaxID=1173677 RepID=A0A5C4RC97_PHOLU|nr:type I-F CRISPR-associated protein Csy1 [Photorhabdus luminescens]TNH41633.1 type I-F CRISPR-associated protein Csy1 [Photorhabdus luminescens subsp. sonorensis]
MNENGLSRFIIDYIESRKQPKLEAFDKEAEKKLAKLTSVEDITLVKQEIAEQRKALEEYYEISNWLDDAANRAKQISLVTHALKFTHSDARGSSIFATSSNTTGNTKYLSTATLYKPVIDSVGNAAALDIAKLLQTEYQEDSLVECLNRGDYSALAELAENDQQLECWVNGFRQALSDETLSSHKLAKQLYFPINSECDGYHLLSPLFSSSLAHATHQRIAEARFGESSKEINKAKKEERWHPETRVIYPNTAVQNIGGTKPQNISYLNSVRGGRAWLLSCAAPNWQGNIKLPERHRSIFEQRSQFVLLSYRTVRLMRQYLFRVQKRTEEVRRNRQAYVDEIIDILFNYVASVQNQVEFKGWSANCDLKRSQQLWLDPYRCQQDEIFKFEREGGDWKKEIADDFGLWLNNELRHEQLEVGLTERNEWASVFKKRLREFEDELPEVPL